MSNIDSHQFNVNLSTYSGPLDVLLDLAKSQKVNLENISVTKLADQFHEFITKAKDINLEIASDYLLMATWLTYLKSKLLLPETDEEEFKAMEVAQKLKSYSSFIMKKDFQRINIPKLPFFTTEDGIHRIKQFFGKLMDWKNIDDLIPENLKTTENFKRTGKAGIFAGALELVKEGDLKIKQEKLFDTVFIRES